MAEKIYNEKMAAEIEGEFVVFLIGARLNKPWKIHKWLPVALAMNRMIKELEAHPEAGFLGCIRPPGPGVMVQYWRSFEQLEAYARSRNSEHWPAWVNFYKKVGLTNGDVGIWHETYKVAPGQYEAIYGAMPAFGLGKVSKLVPAKGRRDTARGRLKAAETPGVITAEDAAAEVQTVS